MLTATNAPCLQDSGLSSVNHNAEGYFSFLKHLDKEWNLVRGHYDYTSRDGGVDFLLLQ
jgi:hypothetical protein